ncbi:MAG: FAD-dependent oxidoreductase [Myxococcota bacterium]
MIIAGLAAVTAVAWAWRYLRAEGLDRTLFTMRPWLARWIERRLGGYRHRVVTPDASQPRALPEGTTKRVAVVGGGLGGLSAATALAERGFDVSLYEANDYLGGKIGGWRETDASGAELLVDHGFHAFFRQYYNLNGFLARLGLDQTLAAVTDYAVMERDGKTWGFADVDTVPVLNLYGLGRAGLYRFRDIFTSAARDEMGVFLEYDAEHTPALLDDTTYETFAARAALPSTLKLVFNTFARAFFADEDRLSMAELVKSFHFYYLSHDEGLVYDYPQGDYETTIVGPIAAHLRAHGGTIDTGCPVAQLSPKSDDRGFVVRTTDGKEEHCDYAVMATPAKVTRAIAEASPELQREAPELMRRLSALQSGQRYAIVRLWLDRPFRDDVPVFFATERHRVLDSVSSFHRIVPELRQWADVHGGSVIELHCYAIPDGMGDAEVEAAMVDEMRRFFVELSEAMVLHRAVQVRDDFTAFHTGLAATRPETEHQEVPGLSFAGDWVKLPIPCMLMEAAFTSGLYAANTVLRREGLREHAIDSVPSRGLLADLAPRRKKVTPVAAPARPLPAE